MLGNQQFEGRLIGVIGSRKASSYGRWVVDYLVPKLVTAGLGIVSGLALGIDSLAHKSCLDSGGYTVAVLPADLNHVYPRSHFPLAERILTSGGLLVSEHQNLRSPAKYHFYARNRIISGLSEELLVIEAGERSGSSITVGHALEQGKTVLAVPGPINQAGSVGTNRLIKQGAIPVSDAEDIFQVLGINSKKAPDTVTYTNLQQEIVNLVKEGQHELSDIQTAISVEPAQLNQALSELELMGKISFTSGAVHLVR